MPGAGFEPARAFNSPWDFKSHASANSAIPAKEDRKSQVPLRGHLGRFDFLMKIKPRRGAESNRRIQVLQTRALPLCYRANLPIFYFI